MSDSPDLQDLLGLQRKDHCECCGRDALEAQATVMAELRAGLAVALGALLACSRSTEPRCDDLIRTAPEFVHLWGLCGMSELP